MEDDLVKRITSNPTYQELKSKRCSFGWWLLLSQKIGSGVTTLGMPLGVAVIVFTIIITWIYIRRANSEFDALTDKIVKGALK